MLGGCIRERIPSVIKRISLLVAVALVAALMLAVTSGVSSAAPKCGPNQTAVKTGPGTFQCVSEGSPNEKFTCEETFHGAPSANKSEGEETLNPQGHPTNANQC
jgi:hypothetical protein